MLLLIFIGCSLPFLVLWSIMMVKRVLRWGAGKVGARRAGAQKGGGPKGGGPKFSRFFTFSRSHFHSFFLSLGIFSCLFGGVLVGRFLKCACFRPRVVVWKHPPAQIPREDSQRERKTREDPWREKKNENGSGRKKKSAKCWAPHPSGPTLRGPTFSRFGLPPFRAPRFRALPFGAPPVGAPPLHELCLPTTEDGRVCVWVGEIGLSRMGQSRMGLTRINTLASVELAKVERALLTSVRRQPDCLKFYSTIPQRSLGCRDSGSWQS